MTGGGTKNQGQPDPLAPADVKGVESTATITTGTPQLPSGPAVPDVDLTGNPQETRLLYCSPAPPRVRAPESVRAGRLEPGTRAGRYLIIECIGEGAMGQVYAAFDPELDRKVALKILSVERTGDRLDSSPGHSPSSTRSSAARRLLREAKALSQLAHPNVVAVYDVGTLEAEVFVAMEFVAGKDLKQWAAESPRSWQHVLEVYIQAGQGLAAAHAAGLVHRDFKPQNAVLGADGRVRVLDFGLATTRTDAGLHQGSPELLDHPIAEHGSGSDAWERLTQTGVVLGTPAYMAPEVICGEAADDKSDQFSFCVSLFRSVYGEAPFTGNTLRELRNAILGGHVKEVEGAEVPGWLRKALVKGMAAQPAHRFSSMDALLAVLERKDPATVKRRWLWRGIVVGALTASLVLTVNFLATRNSRLCEGADRHLQGVWDAARKKSVKESLMATRLTYAADTWTRVQDSLDRYTHAWTTMHTQACLATHVSGEQSGELLDLRMRCLRERLAEVNALVTVLSRADKEMVVKAAPAAASLVEVSVCADEETLRTAIPPPTDPTARAQLDALREKLEHARALEKTAKYVEATELVEKLEPDARALGYLPLMAEVATLKGLLLSDRGKYAEAVPALEEADALASRAGHARMAAAAEAELVNVVGYQLVRVEEALVRARYAEATLLLSRLFDKEGDRLLTIWGQVLTKKSAMAEAIEMQQRALDLCIKNRPPDDCYAIRRNLGQACHAAGRLEEGRKHLEDVVTSMEKSLGPTHPELARAMNNLGLILTEMGKYDEAMEWLQQARTAFENSLGADHPNVAKALNNIGNVHWWRGEYEDALKAHQHTLAIRLKALEPDHPDVGASYLNIGSIHEAIGNWELSRINYQHCLELITRKLGADSELAMGCLAGLGNILVAEKKFDLAQPILEKVLATWTRIVGPTHFNLAEPLLRMAQVAEARRDNARAKQLLRQALELHKSNKIENTLTALFHLRLAGLLWNAEATRKEAVHHAETVREIMERTGTKDPAVRQQVNTWMQEHGMPTLPERTGQR